MVVRENFEKSLMELQDKILEISHLAAEAIEKSFNALKNQDIDLALEVIEEDVAIDELDVDINNFIIWLIAKEQPVSRDLRKIIGALKITAEIERVADFAVNISKATVKMGEGESFLANTKLEEMKDLSLQMLEKAVRAFIEEDIALAKEVGLIDDQVDDYYVETSKSITGHLKEQPEALNQMVQLLFINRHLERTADHITNIAENAAYLIKGRRYDFNS